MGITVNGVVDNCEDVVFRLAICILQSENRQTWVFIDTFIRKMDSKLCCDIPDAWKCKEVCEHAEGTGGSRLVSQELLSSSRGIVNAGRCCAPKYCH